MKKFSCHSCAGCCHGSISLTHEEVIYRFSGDFPVFIAFIISDVRNVPIENEKDAYSKAMKKFNKTTIAFYDKTIKGRKVVVHPQILTLVPPDSPCPNLSENNLCDIYSRKPQVCTLYPFRVDTPITHVKEGLIRERNTSLEGLTHIPCKGWDDKGEPLLENNMPKDADVTHMIGNRNKEFLLTRDLLKEYYKSIKDIPYYAEKIEQFSSLNNQGSQLLKINYAKFLTWLIDNNKIHEQVAYNIMQDQKKQLSLQLEKSSNRKDNIGITFSKIYTDFIKELDTLKK